MLRLLSYEKAPPGEFQFEQVPRDGAKAKRWKSPLILEMAGKVADFRKGNNLPRSSNLETLEDIDSANCARLQAQLRTADLARFVVDTDAPFVGPSGGGGGCASCGAQIE